MSGSLNRPFIPLEVQSSSGPESPNGGDDKNLKETRKGIVHYLPLCRLLTFSDVFRGAEFFLQCLLF
jgi:hypothetical protein